MTFTRVIPKKEIQRYDLKNIENPFFAESYVKTSLYSTQTLWGLKYLIDECRSKYVGRGTAIPYDDVLKKIRDGDWLLVKDEPFNPLSRDISGRYAHITGRRAPFNYECGAYGLLPPTSEPQLTTLLSAPSDTGKNDIQETARGAGRWVTIEVDYDGIKNSIAFLANRLTSMADEGRAFLTDGKDYANTSRTLIQEWKPLAEDQIHLLNRSVVRDFGEVRRVRQQYLEGSDEWQTSGSSWHWQPVTADVVYEFKEG